MVLRSRDRPRAYQLHGRIAAGGMGEVYEATATEMGRKVAVKRMLDADASDEDLKLMFLREVAVAATLEHHNVVEVLDAGQNGNELFLVMELVDGPSLAEVIEVLKQQNRILPVEISCHIVACIAQALTHAHERSLPDGTPLGIVHRDVAPENVLIGSEGLPKLVDFGLAKLSGHSLTQPGVIRGRPRSLSPEQARGDAVDARSDLFSLGAMLFELIAGQPLYPGEQMATLLYKVAAGEYPPIGPRLRHADQDLVALIKTAVAPDPNERFRSAREIDRQLDNFRAARGMRVSARTVAQVVSVVKPAVEELRKKRMDDSAGELDGARLILPADRLDTQAEVEGMAKNSSGGFLPSTPKKAAKGQAARTGGSAAAASTSPPAKGSTKPPTPASTVPTPNRAQSLSPSPDWAGPLPANTPTPTGELVPNTSPGDLGRAGLASSAYHSELPKPAAPAKALQGNEGGSTGWTVYVAAVVFLAGAVFAAAWFGSAPLAPLPVKASDSTAQSP